MQAVINLSSEATMLRPLSCDKCAGMLSLGQTNVTEYMITSLKKYNITDIVIITGYMPNSVRQYFNDGENWDVNIKYVTGGYGDGALKTHSDILSQEFVYFTRPVYTDTDFAKKIRFHQQNDAYVTVVTPKGVNQSLVCDNSGRVTRLEEKRMWGTLGGEDRVGIYILNRDVVRFMPEDATVDLVKNVLPSLIRAGKSVYSVPAGNTCCEIYDVASYMRANIEFLESLKSKDSKGIIIEPDAEVEKGALLEGPCYIGSNAKVCKGAKIGAHSSIGKNSLVMEGASIKRSIIGENCRIGKESGLRGCILDEDVVLGKNVTVYEQAVIGRGTKAGDNTRIKSFVKIWPEKNIEPNSTVSENIMWGQKKRARLFEQGVIEGTVNVDITPRFCNRLGECVGRELGIGEIGVSTDGSPAGVMLRDSVVSALLGMGMTVKDFGEQPLPITRRGVAFYMLKGAVCINITAVDGEEIAQISVIGKNGLDIDDDAKARMEENFEKGDFLYPDSKNIKECEYVFEYKLYYLKSLIGYGKRSFKRKKILLSCSAAWGRRLIASAMSDFSCSVSMYEPSVTDESLDSEAFYQAVKLGGFDIGFVLNSKCEQLRLVLPTGIVDPEAYEALTCLVIMKKHKNAKIYVPITSSHVIEHMAEKYDCDVVRTKTTPSEIMRHMAGEANYLYEQFVYRFDAVGAVIKLMEYLQEENIAPEKLMEEIPPIVMAKTLIELTGEQIDDALAKIREIDGAEEGYDGVKITFDKGWVVVMPEAEKDACHIVSEGANAEFARELCDFCVDKMLND